MGLVWSVKDAHPNSEFIFFSRGHTSYDQLSKLFKNLFLRTEYFLAKNYDTFFNFRRNRPGHDKKILNHPYCEMTIFIIYLWNYFYGMHETFYEISSPIIFIHAFDSNLSDDFVLVLIFYQFAGKNDHGYMN